MEELITEIGISNKILWLHNIADALDYLGSAPEPKFLIFSDINMPVMNGLELRGNIDANPILRKKSIQFIFYTTSATQKAVDEAYTQLTIQGFFINGRNYGATKSLIGTIINYWKHCVYPDS